MDLEKLKRAKKLLDEAPIHEGPRLIYFMDQWYLYREDPMSLLNKFLYKDLDMDMHIQNASEVEDDG